MRYRVFMKDAPTIEFFACDFRIWGNRRIKCYTSRDESYVGSEKSVDLYLPSEIIKITDNHGRAVFIE
jgi:hypothetical protein